MDIVDVVWMLVILAGAGYLFYRSFTRKKGPCGCEGCSCSKK
ncbi:MAG: FeoB-associated Cys-rich membrane protein [Desulfuromonadales bacterium]